MSGWLKGSLIWKKEILNSFFKLRPFKQGITTRWLVNRKQGLVRLGWKCHRVSPLESPHSVEINYCSSKYDGVHTQTIIDHHVIPIWYCFSSYRYIFLVGFLKELLNLRWREEEPCYGELHFWIIIWGVLQSRFHTYHAQTIELI